MASPISCGTAWLTDGATFNGLLARTNDVAATILSTGSASAVAARGGVLPAAGAEALQVAAGTGMQVTVNAGYAVVPNATSSLYGAYRMGLLQQGTITLDTSDATNPRIDLIVAQVIDNGDSTSVSQVAAITGTPAPTPSAPSTTGMNVVVLAQISVAANVSSITAGNITDKRQFTAPPGTELLINSQTERDAIASPYIGMKIYRRDTGNEEVYVGGVIHWSTLQPIQSDLGWITFPYASGWSANAGSPGYRKVNVGSPPRVYLRGSVGKGTNVNLGGGVIVGQLPPAYRPAYDVFLPCATQYTTDSTARAQISASTGNVTIQGPQTSVAWISLDGLSFEQGN